MTSLIKESYAEMATTMVNDLRLLHEEGFKFATIILELHYLSRLLEVEKLNLNAVSTFCRRPEIQQLAARLTTAFPDSYADSASSDV